MTTRLNTNSIIGTMDAEQSGATERCLGHADASDFVDDVRRARKVAKRVGLTDRAVCVHYHGGAVPNSYKYNADATHLKYEGGKLSVYRGQAVKARRGISDERRVRLYVGKLADLPEGVEAALRRSRSVKTLRGGYAIL